MSQRVPVFVAFALGVAAGALVPMLVPGAGGLTPQDRIQRLELDLAAARREAHDYQRVARVERERTADLESEIERLRILAAHVPEVAADPPPAGFHAPRRDTPPEKWDERQLREELTRLSLQGREMWRSPLVDQCAAAARAQGETALGLLLQVLHTEGLDERLVKAAAMVLEHVNDPRAVNLLTQRWRAATELEMQRVFLRALANIDGETQVPTLLEVWRDTAADPRLRLLAIHGLAMRRHPVALGLVTAPATAGEEGLRARAIESLHVAARRTEYAAKELIATFSTALLTADGEAQMRLAMLALEGFWDPACVPALRTFSTSGRGPDAVRARAVEIAEGIESGAPRPESAGRVRDPDRRMEEE